MPLILPHAVVWSPVRFPAANNFEVTAGSWPDDHSTRCVLTISHGRGDDLGVGIEQRISELGLQLPTTPSLPDGVVATFSWVRVVGDRVLVSGHGAQALDGSPVGPFGRVPDEVSLEDAIGSAKSAALSVMSSVRGAVGDLDRITAWVTVTGFVQAQPGYARTTAIMNAFSETVLDVFGDQVGQHARTAIGVAALPLNLPVVIAAELSLAPGQ